MYLKEIGKVDLLTGEEEVQLAQDMGLGAEASAALAVLGYSQGEINLALKGLDLEGLTLEQIIKAALKKMMKN